jgi:excisionase family DNA binding protein
MTELTGASPTDPLGSLTLTVPEAGQLLGLGRSAAYEAARRKEIPTIRIGRRLLVPVPLLRLMLGLSVEGLAGSTVSGEAGHPGRLVPHPLRSSNQVTEDGSSVTTANPLHPSHSWMSRG